MIIAVVKIKGGVSEGAGSSRGEVRSVWFQGLGMRWRTQRRWGSHLPIFAIVVIPCAAVFECVYLYGSYSLLVAERKCLKCQVRMKLLHQTRLCVTQRRISPAVCRSPRSLSETQATVCTSVQGVEQHAEMQAEVIFCTD